MPKPIQWAFWSAFTLSLCSLFFFCDLARHKGPSGLLAYIWIFCWLFSVLSPSILAVVCLAAFTGPTAKWRHALILLFAILPLTLQLTPGLKFWRNVPVAYYYLISGSHPSPKNIASDGKTVSFVVDTPTFYIAMGGGRQGNNFALVKLDGINTYDEFDRVFYNAVTRPWSAPPPGEKWECILQRLNILPSYWIVEYWAG